MQALINSTLNNYHPVIHIYFHSSSLIDDATGFMPGENTHDIICNNIKHVIDHTQKKTNIRFCTILKRLLFLIKEKITPNTNHAN